MSVSSENTRRLHWRLNSQNQRSGSSASSTWPGSVRHFSQRSHCTHTSLARAARSACRRARCAARFSFSLRSLSA